MSEVLTGDYYTNNPTNVSVDLKNTRIGYENLTKSAVSLTGASVAGFPLTSLKTSTTYDIWKPASLPATVDIELKAGTPVDYIGLAAHALKDCKITLEYSFDSIGYTVAKVFSLADNLSAMVLIDEISAKFWRMTIEANAVESTFSSDFQAQQYTVSTFQDGTTGGAFLGVLSLGKALAMQRMIYGGHSPAPLSRSTKTIGSDSEGGQFLGKSVVRLAEKGAFSFMDLTAPWYRKNFEPFAANAVTDAFFALWRPDEHANETVYGTSDRDIIPKNQGTINFMQVSFTVKGFRSSV